MNELGIMAGRRPVDTVALIIFLRTMFVWWCVKYWASSRYRADRQLAQAEEYQSEPAARSARRSVDRNRRFALLFRWCCGSLLILFSAGGMLSHTSPGDVLPTLIILGCAVVFVNAVFVAAELVDSRGGTIALTVVAWFLAMAVMSAFCASYLRGGHPFTPVADSLAMIVRHPMAWILGVSGYFVMYPVGDWIGTFMQRWAAQISPEQGLPEGGRWIGRLERLLIVLCLAAGQPAGIAILVTAKGALRYGEIRQGADEGHQRKLIEYILIGSMLSYAAALTTGWLVSGTWPLLLLVT